MCNRKIPFALPLLLMVAVAIVKPAASSAQAPITLDDSSGVWRWHRSSGGFTGETILPTEDKWMQLEFEPEGKLRVSLSGVLAEGTYIAITVPGEPEVVQLEIVGIPPAWPLPYLSQTFIVRSAAGGTLVLDEGCCDRYMHEFVPDRSIVPVEQSSVGGCKALWNNGSN